MTLAVMIGITHIGLVLMTQNTVEMSANWPRSGQ